MGFSVLILMLVLELDYKVLDTQFLIIMSSTIRWKKSSACDVI